MSADPTGAPGTQASGGGAGPGEGAPGPSEEELRKAYEAELSRITSTDMMAQAAVSLLNLGARRLGMAAERQADAPGGAQAGVEAERDLEQVRDSIDGVRALLGILDRRIGQELGPLRDALSQLQMAYAREVAAGAPSGEPGAGGGTGGQPQDSGSSGQGGRSGSGETPPADGGPGPAESSGRLWVPGR